MKTAIVTIGDEILIGQIVDTNSAWMSEKLTNEGFEVLTKISIGDDAQQITNTVDSLFKEMDVVITTGGIGPTKDDITKKTLCDYFGTELIFDESVLANIQNIVSSFTSLNELTRNQAYVPKDYCTIIQNKVGTAPITWFEKDGKTLISLPGVPYEMKHNMENEIIPRLRNKFSIDAYVKQTLIVVGYTESALAIYLEDFENTLPKGFGLAYLPSLGVMKLRLFVRGEHRRSELNEQLTKLKGLLGNAIVSFKDETLQEILGTRLFELGLTVGTAESCTGGCIAHLITLIPGSSRYFKGSVVTYSNEIKRNILNISTSSLEQDGAVSESVAKQMAVNVQKLLATDCAIAISGIAGPEGASVEKPVGTTCIATAYKDKTLVKKYQIGKFRESNILRSSNIAMVQMLAMLDE